MCMQAISLIDEVATEQLAAAEEGERRGSLDEYCDDVRAPDAITLMS